MAIMALMLFAMAWMSSGVLAINPDLPEPVSRVVIEEAQWTGAGTFDLVIGTPKALQVARIPADTTVDVTWRWAAQDNVVLHGQSELWHAGTLAQPIRACADDWPRRSLVVIEASPQTKSARQLAIRLLDRGSADRVLIGADWRQQLSHLVGDDARPSVGEQLVIVQPADTQTPDIAFQGNWAVVRSDDFLDLARQINFPGAKALGEVWGMAQTKGAVQLWGGPNRERDIATGMWLVEVCSGTFTMGSDYLPPKKEDERFYMNERPKHPVTISTFWISETEVTRKQFGQTGAMDGQLPTGNLTWNEAKAFCEKNQLTLPTEAEWEYATRGGSTTAWSFGDDEAQLDKFAWLGEGLKATVHPVGEKLPNPLGLFDVHSNAWEWVEDCYDANIYENRAVTEFRSSAQFVVDPQNDKPCEYRVLRGGWPDDDPELLRSAFRQGLAPEFANGNIGFRCVRRPRRQS